MPKANVAPASRPNLLRLFESKPRSGLLTGGNASVKDLIAPDSFDRSEIDHVRSGRYYAMSAVVTATPASLRVGWFRVFADFAGDVDVSLHDAPYDQADSLNQLTNLISESEALRQLRGTRIDLAQELAKAVPVLYQIRSLVEDGKDTLHRTTIIVTLYAEDLKELRWKASLMEKRALSSGFHLRFLDGRHDEGFYSTVPTALNMVTDVYRIFDSWALASSFPHYAADIPHTKGPIWGINLDTGAFNQFDIWHPELNNRNVVILGVPGAGKSVLIRGISGRLSEYGAKMVVFDHEREYVKEAEVLGGVVFRVGDPDARFNPLDIEADEDVEEGASPVVNLNDKILDVEHLIEAGIQGMPQEQKSLLDEALHYLYVEERGITEHPESLYRIDGTGERVKKTMPRISDLYRWMQEHYAGEQELLRRLVRLTEGRPLGFFDCESSISYQKLANAPIVVMDLSLLEQGERRPLGMQATLDWTWEHFAKKFPAIPKFVNVDEAHIFVESEFMMQALETYARRIRKRSRGGGSGLIVANQDVGKFADHPRGKAIMEMAAVQVIMRHTSGLDQLTDVFRLSAGEVGFVTSAGKGQYLLRYTTTSEGQQSFPMHFLPIPYEHQWVFEDPKGAKGLH